MKTKISETIRQWIPMSQTWINELPEGDESILQYVLLKRTAQCCSEMLNSDNEADIALAQNIIKVINLLYTSGNHYIKNAIENEFFSELIAQETPAGLKKHLDYFSKESREGYLKTILEN